MGCVEDDAIVDDLGDRGGGRPRERPGDFAL